MFNIAIPITQCDNLILDEYQSNSSNIRINRNYIEQDLCSQDEKSPVQFINVISNTLQRFFVTSDVFGDIIKYTIALFVVIDPIGTVPLFIALTENMQKRERKAVSKIAVITAGVLLIVFAVAGTQILSIFGITIFSFLIAGGVLLFIVSIELL
ncbi:MAG: MarC family protein, partial [Nitrososphaeraceae archaeon]|nr:MarC family protein [Nitrososphaeraceae archaeon]